MIVRQRDVFSAKQLHDIALEKARSVVIPGNDTNNTQCNYGLKKLNRNRAKGNPQTIKTLIDPGPRTYTYLAAIGEIDKAKRYEINRSGDTTSPYGIGMQMYMKKYQI